MNATSELLGGHRLFAGFPPGLLAELAARSHVQELETDDVLFRSGEPAERFYLVQRGRIALDVVGHGGAPLTVDSYGPGSLVGLSWLVPPYVWYLDARATEPTTVLSLDAVFVRQSCDDDPRLGYLLLQRVTHDLYERMQSARVRLLDVYGSAGAR